MQWKEWKWNQVPWLSVCAPTVHMRSREAGMGRKVEVEVKEKKEEESSFVKWDSSLRRRWQTIQAAALDKRWRSEWHQAVGMNIIEQSVVRAELWMTECSLKLKGYTTCQVERLLLGNKHLKDSLIHVLATRGQQNKVKTQQLLCYKVDIVNLILDSTSRRHQATLSFIWSHVSGHPLIWSYYPGVCDLPRTLGPTRQTFY